MRLDKSQIWDIGVNSAITTALHTDNKLYDAAKSKMFYRSGEEGIQLLLPQNSIFKLDTKYIINPEEIKINKYDCTFQEAYLSVLAERYNILYRCFSSYFAQSLYFLDTALCICFKKGKGETPQLVTRNIAVLDQLAIAPNSRIDDENRQLYLYDDLVQKQNVPAVFVCATDEGYALKYETIDCSSDDYVLIPFVWYNAFVKTLSNILESHICEVTYCDNGVMKVVYGTKCQTTFDDDTNIKAHYLAEYPTRRLGVLQFVCVHTGNIYNIDICTLKQLVY